jgi:predicted HicB family RNase H-like nuclease
MVTTSQMKKNDKLPRLKKKTTTEQSNISISGVLSFGGYVGSIEYDSDENVFHGKVLYINDSILFSGESIGELKTEFEQSIKDYLEICEAEGLEPNKPMSGTFNIRTSPENHYCLSILSKQQKTTLNHIVNQAISEYIHEKLPAISVNK